MTYRLFLHKDGQPMKKGVPKHINMQPDSADEYMASARELIQRFELAPCAPRSDNVFRYENEETGIELIARYSHDRRA
jgi:hypothetical protein